MNDKLLEPAREVPVAWRGDLVVVGGSCTGLFAAVRAARRGLSVALVERQGFLGGTATAGLVPIWHSFFDTTGEKRIIGGLSREVVERLARRDAVILREPANASVYAVLHTEELKIELDALAHEAGVRVFLHARFAAPWPRPGAGGESGPTPPQAVIIEDKSGRRALAARYFIDASGDGDLLDRAGYATESRDHPQPSTTCAVFTGIAELEKRRPDFDICRAVFDQKYPEALPPGFLWTSEIPGMPDATLVAGTRAVGLRADDADELTRAERSGREQVRRIHDLIRRHFDGGGVRLAATGAHIGVRESRHALALHRLTESELLYGEAFPDAIAQGTYRVDVHNNETGGLVFRYLDGREHGVNPAEPGAGWHGRWRAEDDPRPVATFYGVPYRSLIPRGSTNLWATGRLIDADRGAYGAIRVMVVANQTGEAAGEAAALAIADGRRPAEVDAVELRRKLVEGGSELANR